MVDLSDIQQALDHKLKFDKCVSPTPGTPGDQNTFDITAAANDIEEDVSMTVQGDVTFNRDQLYSDSEVDRPLLEEMKCDVKTIFSVVQKEQAIDGFDKGQSPEQKRSTKISEKSDQLPSQAPDALSLHELDQAIDNLDEVQKVEISSRNEESVEMKFAKLTECVYQSKSTYDLILNDHPSLERDHTTKKISDFFSNPPSKAFERTKPQANVVKKLAISASAEMPLNQQRNKKKRKQKDVESA